MASLDVVSGGRFLLGIGVGYLEPEFAAMGVDFGGHVGASFRRAAQHGHGWYGFDLDLDQSARHLINVFAELHRSPGRLSWGRWRSRSPRTGA